MHSAAKAKLAKVLCEKTYLRRAKKVFLLSTGEASANFFDTYSSLCLATALPLVGQVVLHEILDQVDEPPHSCGGPALGAVSIAQAVAVASLTSASSQINTFTIRRRRKTDGTQKWIEGFAKPGSSVAIVDDVINSGDSILKSANRCRSEGLNIACVVVLIDREAGGMERVRDALPNCPVASVFTKSQMDKLVRRKSP
jgi:orotate phosphoribosyltransferase